MNKIYKSFLIHLFDHRSALLGENIATELVNTFGISRVYARRIIKDAVNNKNLYSSKPLRFAHGQYGYSTIPNKSVFQQLLIGRNDLRELYKLLCITCLPENEMIKFAQSIYTSLKPKEALDKLLTNMSVFDQIKTIRINECDFYYLSKIGANNVKCEDIYQNIKKDAKICQLVYSYFLNLNLISSGRYRDAGNPSLLIGNEVAFDAIGFSTLSKNRSNKKTTFLFDVFISYDSGQLIKRFMKRSKAYYHRQRNGNSNYHSKIINVIVTKENNPSLRRKLDPYRNYMWVGLRQLFGKNIDSFLWLAGQDTKLLGQIQPDESFYKKIDLLAKSDFSHLFSQFLDDYFEIVVNCCMSRITGKAFLGKTIYNQNTGDKKEFDGYYEDEKSIWLIESKNLGKSKVKWESYSSNNRIENDCLKYFFFEKMLFIRNISPKKTIYACYVSKSGFSNRAESESMINLVNKIPGLNSFLLTPQEIIDISGKSKNEKEFEWLNKLYIQNNE